VEWINGTLCLDTGCVFGGNFDTEQNSGLLAKVRAAATKAGLWEELDSGWLLLDAELLPWSAKAGSLITELYAAVGAAAQAALPSAVAQLSAANARGIDVAGLLERTRQRVSDVDAYRAAYRRYCWPTDGLDGVRLGPFQLLASEGATHTNVRIPGTWRWPDDSPSPIRSCSRSPRRGPLTPPIRRRGKPLRGGGRR
jgi:hypothetical protein